MKTRKCVLKVVFCFKHGAYAQGRNCYSYSRQASDECPEEGEKYEALLIVEDRSEDNIAVEWQSTFLYQPEDICKARGDGTVYQRVGSIESIKAEAVCEGSSCRTDDRNNYYRLQSCNTDDNEAEEHIGDADGAEDAPATIAVWTVGHSVACRSTACWKATLL